MHLEQVDFAQLMGWELGGADLPEITFVSARSVAGIDSSDGDEQTLSQDCDQLDRAITQLGKDYNDGVSKAQGAQLGPMIDGQTQYLGFIARWSQWYSTRPGSFAERVHAFVQFRDEYQQRRAQLVSLGGTPHSEDLPFLAPTSGSGVSLTTWITLGAIALGLLVLGPVVIGPFAAASAARLIK